MNEFFPDEIYLVASLSIERGPGNTYLRKAETECFGLDFVAAERSFSRLMSDDTPCRVYTLDLRHGTMSDDTEHMHHICTGRNGGVAPAWLRPEADVMAAQIITAGYGPKEVE